MSSFWIELFKATGTKLRFSTAYHPQLDGQSEEVNRCLSTYLKCFAEMKPKSWPQWLSWAVYWYDTNYHESTKTTPFKALYGRDPHTLLRGDSAPSCVEDINNDTRSEPNV